jgi:hypothetical protein
MFLLNLTFLEGFKGFSYVTLHSFKALHTKNRALQVQNFVDFTKSYFFLEGFKGSYYEYVILLSIKSAQ